LGFHPLKSSTRGFQFGACIPSSVEPGSLFAAGALPGGRELEGVAGGPAGGSRSEPAEPELERHSKAFFQSRKALSMLQNGPWPGGQPPKPKLLLLKIWN